MHPQQEIDTDYLSYMVRIWRKWDGNGKPVWCASLEEPGSRHTERFEDTDAMFTFLQRKLGIEKSGDHPLQVLQE